jgi:formylglycine-generating enzyme required for sulfatase activity
MSPSTPFRVAGACALLVALAGLLSWRTPAADVEVASDVDLTLSEGGKDFTNSVGMKLVRIPKGKFWMGSPNNETSSVNNEHPRHQVELTKDFFIGVYEVTQKQYKAVMGKNPSYFSKEGPGAAQVKGMDTDDFPVEQTTWDDAQAFMKKINELSAERSAGRKYRLPTEAEWEYCCRAGADVKEAFTFEKPSASASSTQANFNGNLPYGGGARGPQLGRTCKVGSYKANPFGLYDMHGNVIEWVEDWYGEVYGEKDRKDPKGPKTGQYKILRSGGWQYDSQFCRSAYRNYSTPQYRSSDCGFRVVCTVRQD